MVMFCGAEVALNSVVNVSEDGDTNIVGGGVQVSKVFAVGEFSAFEEKPADGAVDVSSSSVDMSDALFDKPIVPDERV